jgi:hypothetical protein
LDTDVTPVSGLNDTTTNEDPTIRHASMHKLWMKMLAYYNMLQSMCEIIHLFLFQFIPRSSLDNQVPQSFDDVIEQSSSVVNTVSDIVGAKATEAIAGLKDK